MFKSADNYRFFLKKLDNYLTEVLDVYAYCLLGNHFHLLVKVKEDLSDFRVHKNFKVDTSTHDSK